METRTCSGKGDVDGWVLGELVERLSRSGYSEFYASFNPLAPRANQWLAHRKDIPDQLRLLVELFLLAEPVEQEVLTAVLGDLIPALCDLGLLVTTKDNHLATPGLVLLPVFGNWLFCQRQQVNPVLYFGDDSIALLLRLRPKRGGSCLDLCAGPGVQSLHCSLFADIVTAVEINPVAVALAHLNVVMNGRENIVRVYCGDLYDPIRGQVFDTIVANPPLLPFPDAIPYPFVGHGGADGLRVTWRILRGLPDALATNGTAQLIGTCLSDGILPLCIDSIKTWSYEADMDVLLTVTAHQPLAPGTPYFDGLVNTASTGMNGDVQTIAAEYQRSLAEQGANHLCAYFLHVTPGAGGVRIQDLSRDGAPGLWYV